MLRTVQSLPQKWAFDTGLRPRPFPDEAASLLPGPLAATRTGLTPASDDELTTQDQPPTRSTSCLWAHGKGLSVPFLGMPAAQEAASTRNAPRRSTTRPAPIRGTGGATRGPGGWVSKAARHSTARAAARVWPQLPRDHEFRWFIVSGGDRPGAARSGARLKSG